MEISGSSAFVTGGAGGLGEATVRRLVAAGAKVVIADLAKEKGGSTGRRTGLGRLSSSRPTSPASRACPTPLDRAASMGPVRVSVAVHGGFGGGGRTLKADGNPHSLEDFRKVIDPYLVGTFNVLRLASLRPWRSRSPWRTVSAVSSSTPPPSPATKARSGRWPTPPPRRGVIGMTIAAARDLAVVGIRVVTIAPGTFITPAYGADPEVVEAYWAPAVPFPKRMGQPAEYAQTGAVHRRRTPTSTAR